MPVMIKLHKLDSDTEFFMNMSMIYKIEGDKTSTKIWDSEGYAVYVKESPEEIQRLIEYEVYYMIWRK